MAKDILTDRIATNQTVDEWRTEATTRLKQLWKRAASDPNVTRSLYELL